MFGAILTGLGAVIGGIARGVGAAKARKRQDSQFSQSFGLSKEQQEEQKRQHGLLSLNYLKNSRENAYKKSLNNSYTENMYDMIGGY